MVYGTERWISRATDLQLSTLCMAASTIVAARYGFLRVCQGDALNDRKRRGVLGGSMDEG